MVIRIGRKRSSDASRIASSGVIPCDRSSSIATSMIRIAFFLTMPISRMTPISAMISNCPPVTISAKIAPTPAEGSVESTVKGWIALS